MNRIVAFALRYRLLTVTALITLIVAGAAAFRQLNIEAYPDPVPPMVDIITQRPGLSAEEIERQITIPIEIGLTGIPHVKSLRTLSLFGLSDVKVQFTYDFTYQEAQQWVINRLGQIDDLPAGVQPQISPDSPIGEIYHYRVTGPKGYSNADLKTLQDWVLERRFRAIPGVIDVSAWGASRAYEVNIDNNRLVAH
ncbi:MAG: efflux RND transporter permease subunit, partial [Gallionellaceae bacterium]|nr:efflux RND transporter permease subunit [Gallionellaceae bacterium]